MCHQVTATALLSVVLLASNPVSAQVVTDYAYHPSPADVETILTAVTSGESKLTFVNMWATWCAPCIEEFPDFVELASSFPTDQLRVLFVSVDFPEEIVAVGRFLEKQGWSAPSYLKDQADDAFVNGFSTEWSGAVPATFLYDASGSLLWFTEGKTDSATLARAVSEHVD